MKEQVKEKKLKDYIDECITEATADISANICDTTKVLVINKYLMMLNNIKKICENRNKF